MKKDRKKLAIISRESDDKTLDVAMLEAELLRRGCDVKVLSKLLTKERSLKAIGYVGHMIKQEAAILAADVVVLDTYCIPASMLPHLGGTKVVQMWHALGAIKKFGWQTVGKDGGSSERTARLMKMHKGYDYVVCASDVTAEHFSEAFKTDKARIVKYGLPRIDYIKSVSVGERREDMQKKILAKYPALKTDEQLPLNDGSVTGRTAKKIVLYAPTFRRGKAVDVQSLMDALDPDRYNLVVKLHPLYRGAVENAHSCSNDHSFGNNSACAVRSDVASPLNVIYDEDFSSFDWLAVADIIISDYSSFVIESTLADKPLFIYAYDLDEYEENTGLNIDFESEPIAPYVFRNAKQIAECIDSACAGNKTQGYDFDVLKAFRDRYIDIDTDNCTAALADFIESLA